MEIYWFLYYWGYLMYICGEVNFFFKKNKNIKQ